MLVNSSWDDQTARTGTLDIKMALTMAIGNAMGVLIGSTLLEYLRRLPRS